jgi:hypothetical protein
LFKCAEFAAQRLIAGVELAIALRKPALSIFSRSRSRSAVLMGSLSLRKAFFASSIAWIRRSVSISRLRSASLSWPTRAPTSASVG